MPRPPPLALLVKEGFPRIHMVAPGWGDSAHRA
jgi:hypothetical protein